MTPREYFETIVLPTYSEYRSDPLSLRRALLTCMVITHVADVVHASSGLSTEELLLSLIHACPSFMKVRAIGLVSKHMVLERGQFKGLGISEVVETNGAAFDDGSYFDDGMSWDDSPQVIGLKSPKHGFWDLSVEIEKSIAFLDEYTQGGAAG